MIERRSYVKSFDKSKRTLAKSLMAYLKNPREDNVHDLRTSIRRMLVLYQLLPKKVRDTKQAIKYALQYDKLMRLNAKTRDIDIILAKISRQDHEGAYGSVIDDLRKARTSSLHPAQRLALSIRNSPTPKIRGRDLSNQGLEKRFKKIKEKLLARIDDRLPIVLENPAEKNELHLLREDSRRLRYVLELAKSRKVTKPVTVLRSWQDTLGAIHDNDVFIQHFEDQKKSPAISSLVREEEVERRRTYENFRSMAKKLPKILN